MPPLIVEQNNVRYGAGPLVEPKWFYAIWKRVNIKHKHVSLCVDGSINHWPNTLPPRPVACHTPIQVANCAYRLCKNNVVHTKITQRKRFQLSVQYFCCTGGTSITHSSLGKRKTFWVWHRNDYVHFKKKMYFAKSVLNASRRIVANLWTNSFHR